MSTDFNEADGPVTEAGTPEEAAKVLSKAFGIPLKEVKAAQEADE